jgi:hypothetical protein
MLLLTSAGSAVAAVHYVDVNSTNATPPFPHAGRCQWPENGHNSHHRSMAILPLGPLSNEMRL